MISVKMTRIIIILVSIVAAEGLRSCRKPSGIVGDTVVKDECHVLTCVAKASCYSEWIPSIDQ